MISIKKFLSSKENIKYLLLLITIIIAHFIYIFWSNTPPHWDAGRHLHNATRYLTYFKEIIINSGLQGNRIDNLKAFFESYFYYPPLVHYFTIPFLVILGLSYKSVLIANIFWIALLFYFSKKWMDFYIENGNAKIITLLFLFSSPFIIGNSRELQLDIPILAMTFVVLFFLEKLNNEFSYKNIIFAVAIIMLAFLVKWNFVIYGAVIIPIYLIKIIYNNYKKIDINYILFSIYISLTSAISICYWYFSNLGILYHDLTKNSTETGISEGDPQGITIKSFEFFIDVIVNSHFRIPWLIFLISLLIILLTKYFKNIQMVRIDNNKLFLLLFSLILFITMLFYHMKQGNKDTRYVVIFYVSYIGIISVFLNFLFSYLDQKKVQIILFISILLFSIQQFVYTLPVSNANFINYNLIINKKSYSILNSSGYTYEGNIRTDYNYNNTLNWIKNDLLKYNFDKLNCYINRSAVKKISVGIYIQNQTTFHNPGSYWGLTELYHMAWSEAGPQFGCYTIINMNDSITIEELYQKYNYLNEYKLVNTFSDYNRSTSYIFRRIVPISQD